MSFINGGELPPSIEDATQVVSRRLDELETEQDTPFPTARGMVLGGPKGRTEVYGMMMHFCTLSWMGGGLEQDELLEQAERHLTGQPPAEWVQEHISEAIKDTLEYLTGHDEAAYPHLYKLQKEGSDLDRRWIKMAMLMHAQQKPMAPISEAKQTVNEMAGRRDSDGNFSAPF